MTIVKQLYLGHMAKAPTFKIICILVLFRNAHTYYFVVFFTGKMPRSKKNMKRTPIAKTALSSSIKLVLKKNLIKRGCQTF